MIGVGEAHRLTAGGFDGLAAARPDPATLEELRRSQLSWRLLTLRTVAALCRERLPRLWGESGAARGWEVLAAVDRADRPALETVLMHPPTGVLLARCLRRLSGPDVEPGLVDDLARIQATAVAAALRARLPLSLDLPVRGDRLALPTWGVARLPAGTRTVRLEGAVLTAPGLTVEPGAPAAADPPPRAPGWLPLRTLALPPPGPPPGPLRRPGIPGPAIGLEDGDPDRHIEGLRSAPRLTADQVAGWESSLRGAWDLLAAHFPDRAAACAALCRCVVPLVPPPGGWATSSSREAFGGVWLSPTTDTVRLAEVLVHEVSHVALGALGDLVDLHDPDWTGRLTVGWRRDPRPLGAVLQGTYAHAAVVAFWDHYRTVAPRAEADRAERRHRLLRGQVLDALDLLDGCAGLTPLGRRFCEGMAAGIGARPPGTTPVQLTQRYSNG